MGNLKNTVIKQMKDIQLKKQANLLKIAQDGPVIETKITYQLFSMLDDNLLKELSEFKEDIEAIDFDIDETQSYIKWTISADIKGDMIEIQPIIKEIKIIGDIVAETVSDDKELRKENVEIPININEIKIDFYMDNGIITIQSIEVYKGELTVTFWDK